MHSYAILGLASLAAAGIVPGSSHLYGGNDRNGTVTTTRVVDVYTTYCPEPTTFELGGKTYEVSEPTTLTISECPCTIVEPCYTCPSVPTATGTPGPKPPGPSPTKPATPGPNPPIQTGEPSPPPMTGAAAGQNGVALVGAAVFGLLAL